MKKLIAPITLLAALGLFAYACGDDEGNAPTTQDVEAADTVDQGVGEAFEEASASTSALTASVQGLDCTNGCEVFGGLVTITGDLSANPLNLTFEFDGYLSIIGSVTVTGDPSSAVDCVYDVTVDGYSVDGDYTLDTDTGDRDGTINGRDASLPPASDDDDDDDNQGNIFAQCDENSTDPCVQAACAYKQGYDSCVDNAGGSACDIYTNCIDDYLSCVCPGGSISTDAGSIQTCAGTYLDCIL